MSYVLHLWEGPAPSSVAEADRQQERLSRELSGQNPKFLALAEELTGRYPCSADLPDESPAAVWIGSPLDGKTEHAAYAIGVQADHVAQVVPFVVASARKLGLTVYDMQAANVFLPDGRVLCGPPLPQCTQNSTDDETGELQSNGQVQALVSGAVGPLMEQSGFKFRKADHAFVRRFRGHAVDLGFRVEDDYPGRRFKLYARFTVKEGLDLLKAAIDWPVGEYTITSWTEKFRNFQSAGIAGYPADGWFRVRDVAALQAAIVTQSEYLRSAVLPCLGECSTLTGVDKYMNRIPVDACPLGTISGPAINLLVAHLSGNPQFDELERHLLAVSPDYHQAELQAMGAYLRGKRRD